MDVTANIVLNRNEIKLKNLIASYLFTSSRKTKFEMSERKYFRSFEMMFYSEMHIEENHHNRPLHNGYIMD